MNRKQLAYFGRHLLRWRYEHKKSLHDAAKLCHLSTETISRLEKEKETELHDDTMFKILDGLNVTEAEMTVPIHIKTSLTTDEKIDIVDWVESNRKAEGLSTRKFSKKIGISWPTFNGYLIGSSLPDIFSAWKMAEAYGTTVEAILKEMEE